LPQPLQEGELAGLFFQLAEHLADGLRLVIVLQEIGQQTVTEKDLGDAVRGVFLGQKQSLQRSMEQVMDGLDVQQHQIGQDKQEVPRAEEDLENRILSPQEYIRLLAHCPAHIKPIVKLAYHTGMRQGEILNLTWGQVEVKEGFIKLEAWNTITSAPHLVPLTREPVEMFKAMPRGFPAVKVFTYAGRQIGAIKTALKPACKRAGIEDFTFHDLQYTAINNWTQSITGGCRGMTTFV
jgi:integrase